MNNPLVLKKNRIFYLITLLGFLYVVYYIFCVSTDKKAFRRNHIDERCQYRVVLEDLSSEKLPDNYVYFIETSGRDYLSDKHTCAVESALKNAGLSILVILNSRTMNLSASESTCDIYYSSRRLSFYYLDFETLLKDTPAENINARIKLSKLHKIAYQRDISKMAIAYKFGGLYIDLDFIVIGALHKLKNVISMDNGQFNPSHFFSKESCKLEERSKKARWLHDGHFHFTKGHIVPWSVLNYINKTFDLSSLVLNQTGSTAVTEVIKQLYNISQLSNSRYERSDSCETDGIEIVPDFTFTNFGRFDDIFWPEGGVSQGYWETLFHCSHTVYYKESIHAANPLTRNINREAISYLASKHCPVSFRKLRELNFTPRGHQWPYILLISIQEKILNIFFSSQKP